MLVTSPVSDHLFLFGGENYDGQKVEMYADVSHPSRHKPSSRGVSTLTECARNVQMYRYDPAKNEWRKFSSPTQPGPRAAHQMVGTVAGGGRLWVHGGEYCKRVRVPVMPRSQELTLARPPANSRTESDVRRLALSSPLFLYLCSLLWQVLLPLPRLVELLDRKFELGALGDQGPTLGAVRSPDGRLQELHLLVRRMSTVWRYQDRAKRLM